MFGGSVRDRIKAAEAAQGGAKANASSHSRRGQKLALNTDEHIKEEFLRRGDGGWSKNVDIGQQEAFVPSASVPFIKVTSETPIVESKEPKLPGKLPKSKFASISEEQEEDPSRAASASKVREPSGGAASPNGPQQEGNPKAESATRTIDPAKRESEPEYAEDSLPVRPRKESRRRSSKSLHARVDDVEESHADADEVGFSEVEWNDSHASRSSSKHSHRKGSSRKERSSLKDIDGDETPRARSRSSRPKSAHREPHSHHEDHHNRTKDATSPRIRKSSSRSGSSHRQSSESHHSPLIGARRSSGSLWPSFSTQTSRSMTDIFGAASTRSKSPQARPRSAHSTTSVRTDDTSKTLEYAEYIAGKKLEHVPSAPLSPAPKARPLGFVRSKSSSGEYSEFYTRDKHMLRKPDDDEVFEPTDETRIDVERRRSHHGSGDHRKSDATPWQVKLMQGIARF